MKLLIALIAVSFIFYLSCLDWKRSVKTVFLLVVLEGILRKWILPQASELIYFLKDIVLFGAYFQYYALSKSERKFPKTKTPFINIWLFLAFSWCVFLSFNPSLGSPIVGVWGIKNYFFYLPLMWMLPNLFETEEDLYLFLRTQLLIFIGVGILGVVQFISPASSPINQYAPGLERAHGVARFAGQNKARITGAFAFVNNYVAYLLICFGFLIPILERKQPQKWRNIAIFAGLLLVGNSFMTGSRTIILAELLFLLGYLGVKAVTHFYSTLRLLKWILPPALIVSVSASILLASEINTVLDRVLSTRGVYLRIQLLFLEPLYTMQIKGFDGFGPGAVHQATGVLRGVLGLPPGEFIPIDSESEMGRIMLEIGPLGFIFWYALKFSIIVALFQVAWRLKRPFLRNLGLAAFLIQAIWFPSQHVFHITFSVYYGFLSGFIFLLPHLERVENWRQQQQLLELNEESPYLSHPPYW